MHWQFNDPTRGPLKDQDAKLLADAPPTQAQRLWWNVRKCKGEGCWPFTGGLTRGGYGRIAIDGRRGHVSRIGAHKLAWIVTYGPVPKGLFVCHRCNNPTCCRPDHLYLATGAENTAHAKRDGLILKGDVHPARLHPERMAHGDNNGARMYPERLARGEAVAVGKLTEAQVREIRARHAAGESGYKLAPIFGVSQVNISCIVRGKTWRHLL